METSVKVFTQISEFFDYLGADQAASITEVLAPATLDSDPKFPFICSRHYADLIKKSAEPEALMREVLPLMAEREKVPGFVDDPVGDLPAGKSDCVIQKYDKRALVVSTATCGMRCRFCFRKNYPFQNIPDIAGHVGNWLDTHTDIWEVILSGGDPLTLGPGEFRDLVETIAVHGSVTTLRIHTRLPVIRPDIAMQHFELLRELPARFECVLVSHVDHPDELDEESQMVFGHLRFSGWTLLNQSVLLKGVNDNAATLEKLSHKLFTQGVLPYYLHQLDHANGVAHFEVDDDRARELIAEIRTRLPGYLVPKLVREIAGEKSKTPI
ncbi:KamA family radical SAM protein [uncultured Fibrobacter sp.]|uniref:KamA family radical SAM protein n=1 Tax=uncultured Fibrobacter sp. TaxID=261512 RepID=UPI00262E1005|nr:KamA family radical SAM protein [uncultured Fibrobacter sp.]